MELIKELIQENKAVLFSGNNYSKEWHDEAKRRELPILDSSAEALEVFNQAKSVEFLIKRHVFTEEEIAARYNVAVERYVKTLDIELVTMHQMIDEYVVPAIEKQLIRSYGIIDKLSTESTRTLYGSRVQRLENILADVMREQSALNEFLERLGKEHDEPTKMRMIKAEGKPAAEKLRLCSDMAEKLVDDGLWPLPKYREMLFAHSIS